MNSVLASYVDLTDNRLNLTSNCPQSYSRVYVFRKFFRRAILINNC